MTELTGSIEDLQPHIDARLQVIGEASWRHEALICLQTELRQTVRPEKDAPHRALNPSLNESNVYYAIRESELGILGEVSGVVAQVMLGASAPIAIVGPLLVLLYRYRNRRIRLSGHQGLVLSVLVGPPARKLSLPEIAAQASMNCPITEEDVATALHELTQMEREGSPERVSLVQQDGASWNSVDV